MIRQSDRVPVMRDQNVVRDIENLSRLEGGDDENRDDETVP
jgi:hypothetical protein